MTLEQPLILYTRENCHLCHQVVLMMQSQGLRWQAVDIDDDPELLEKFAVRIPVLAHPGSKRELFYPFNEQRLLQFARRGD